MKTGQKAKILSTFDLSFTKKKSKMPLKSEEAYTGTPKREFSRSRSKFKVKIPRNLFIDETPDLSFLLRRTFLSTFFLYLF